MSLINQMLRDLERRRAGDETAMARPAALVVVPASRPPRRLARWGLILVAPFWLGLSVMLPWVDNVPAKPSLPDENPPLLPSLRLLAPPPLDETPVPLPAPASLQTSRQLALPSMDEEPPPSWLSQADAWLQQDKPDRALQVLRQGVRQEPGNASLRLLLARLLWEQARQQEAIRVLTHGLARTPHSEMSRLLAHFLLQQEQPRQALTILEKAAKALGWDHQRYVAGDPELAALLAAVHAQTGNHPQAADWYQALLQVEPNQARHWLGLAVAWDALGRFQDARSAYRRALDLGPLPATLSHHANLRLAALAANP